MTIVIMLTACSCCQNWNWTDRLLRCPLLVANWLPAVHKLLIVFVWGIADCCCLKKCRWLLFEELFIVDVWRNYVISRIADFLKLLVCSCNYYKNGHKICHSVVYISSEKCLFFDVMRFALLCFSLPRTVVLCCLFLLSTGVVCSSKAGPRHPVLVEHSAVYGRTGSHRTTRRGTTFRATIWAGFSQ